MSDVNWRRAAEQIRGGAAVLREHGWTGGTMRDEGDCFCAVGAVVHAVDPDALDRPTLIEDWHGDFAVAEDGIRALALYFYTHSGILRDGLLFANPGELSLGEVIGEVTYWNDDHSPLEVDDVLRVLDAAAAWCDEKAMADA